MSNSLRVLLYSYAPENHVIPLKLSTPPPRQEVNREFEMSLWQHVRNVIYFPLRFLQVARWVNLF